jgi:ankyrin repeat protein
MQRVMMDGRRYTRRQRKETKQRSCLPKHKADADAKDDNGWTALRIVAKNGHGAVVLMHVRLR